MPNKKLEAARVPRVVGSDKRLKLTAEEKEAICDLRKEGHTLIQIAEHFGVCKQTIRLITSQEARDKAAQYRKDVGWKTFYDKERHAASMRRHRAHKRRFIKS